jgi:glycosyltransferase involved in cell wall biosynthesis
MYNHFNGKIIQVIEGLDVYDACSNHVLHLDALFKNEFKLNTRIYVKHFHPDLENLIFSIDGLDVADEDIIIFHSSGYSEFCADIVRKAKCFKILHYHNITPHYFFEKGTHLYNLCKRGRDQLKVIFSDFDFITGDSYYNLKEIIDLGFDANKTFKLPIVLEEHETAAKNRLCAHDNANNILFVGRICENKKQDKLISAYAKLKRQFPILGKLVLVGGYDKSTAFFKAIQKLISDLNLKDEVLITGKISEADLDKQYQNALCFISFSEHEGFGVPLLEAAQYGIPVLALNEAAVSETLEFSPALFTNEQELFFCFEKILNDSAFRKQILDHQSTVSRNNSYKAWIANASDFLEKIIGSPTRFKTLSYVICTYNRGDFLDRCLDYLTRAYNPNFEVIVVNGPSTDNTASVINKWKENIIYAENSIRNLSISRNIGINLASGDIIIFIDDDAIPFYDYGDKILNYFNASHNYVAGAGGPTYYAGTLGFQAIDIVVDSFGSGVVNPTREVYRSEEYRRSLLGTNSAFRRDILLAAGAFDEEYDYFLDETDVCFRLIDQGLMIQHCPDAYLRHEFAQSDNRTNKYKYNWFSIVKNTVYFSLRYNQDDKDFLIRQVKNIVEKTRISYLEGGVHSGEISLSEYRELSDAVWAGFDAGIKAAELPVKLNRVDGNVAVPHVFRPFIMTDTVRFEKLHIVIVSKEFPPFSKSGGIGTLYYHLASELLLQGHDITVITQGADYRIERGNFRLSAISAPAVAQQYTSSALANTNLSWSLRIATEIDAINEYRPISVVDTCLWDAECYGFTLIKDELNIPLVVRLVTPLAVANETNGWNMPDNDRIPLISIERKMVSRADAIIPISGSIQKTFTEKYDFPLDQRFSIINAGIAYWPSYDVSQGYNDISHYPELVRAKTAGKMIFLFLGRLEKRKGIDILIKAIRTLVRRSPNLHQSVSFVLAGSDCIGLPEMLAQELTSEEQLSITYLGEVTDWDREKLYAFCDVVVFPSRYESFGLVPLEAFVHGKPVIASNAGAIPEVVLDDVCGLIFEDGSDVDLADKIDRLHNDPALYDRLAIGAKERVRYLSSNRSAQQTVNLYNNLILDKK